MSTLAETVETSVSELERLTEMGIISEDLAHHLLSVMNITRTGRLFGHDSAVTYPKKILEMTNACSTKLDQDGKKFDEIKEAVSKKFAGRARKPTELNRIISSVVDEITNVRAPSVMNLEEGSKSNWFFSLFKGASKNQKL